MSDLADKLCWLCVRIQSHLILFCYKILCCMHGAFISLTELLACVLLRSHRGCKECTYYLVTVTRCFLFLIGMREIMCECKLQQCLSRIFLCVMAGAAISSKVSWTNDVLCNIYVNTEVYLLVTECVQLLQRHTNVFTAKNCVPLLPLVSVFIAMFLCYCFFFQLWLHGGIFLVSL